MPKPLDSFQPGIDAPNAPDGVSYLLTSPQVSPCAVVEMHNNSPYQFKVYGMPGMAYLGLMPINAQTAFTLKPIYQQLQFTPTVAVNKSAAPLANVAGDIYEQEEADAAELSTIPMPQQTNVGNAVSTTNVTSVTNLNGSPGQSIVEAALTGNPVQVNIEVDGTVSISVISNNVLTQVFQITPGDATHAATVELHGVADSANSVQASGITGTLPASQVGTGYPAADITGTLPASQVGTGYPGADISGAVADANTLLSSAGDGVTAVRTGSGTNPRNYLIATPGTHSGGETLGGQVFDGTTSHQSILLNMDGSRPADPGALTAGALASGVTIPAGQVTGTLPASQVGTGYPAADITGTLPASQVGTGYPGADVTGAVGSANGLTLDSNTATQFTGHTAATNYATLITPQPASTAQNFSIRSWDGTASHDTVVVDNAGGIHTGNLNSGALPSGVTISSAEVVMDGNKRFFGVQFLSESASGTYSHGLGNTPSGVFCNTDNGSNSTTFGSGSYTSSSVYIYEYASMAFVAEVMRGG